MIGNAVPPQMMAQFAKQILLARGLRVPSHGLGRTAPKKKRTLKPEYDVTTTATAAYVKLNVSAVCGSDAEFVMCFYGLSIPIPVRLALTPPVPAMPGVIPWPTDLSVRCCRCLLFGGLISLTCFRAGVCGRACGVCPDPQSVTAACPPVTNTPSPPTSARE